MGNTSGQRNHGVHGESRRDTGGFLATEDTESSEGRRCGYVDVPEHWRYSSARNYMLEDHTVPEIDDVPRG